MHMWNMKVLSLSLKVVKLWPRCPLSTDDDDANNNDKNAGVSRARNSRFETRKMRAEIQFCELKI